MNLPLNNFEQTNTRVSECEIAISSTSWKLLDTPTPTVGQGRRRDLLSRLFRIPCLNPETSIIFCISLRWLRPILNARNAKVLIMSRKMQKGFYLESTVLYARRKRWENLVQNKAWRYRVQTIVKVKSTSTRVATWRCVGNINLKRFRMG